jgi:hypothetical protein
MQGRLISPGGAPGTIGRVWLPAGAERDLAVRRAIPLFFAPPVTVITRRRDGRRCCDLVVLGYVQ